MAAKKRRFSIGQALSFGVGYFLLNLVIRALFHELSPRKLEELFVASLVFGILMSLALPYADRLDAKLKRLFSRRAR